MRYFLILSFALLLFPNNGKSQYEDSLKNGLLLRGKVLGGFFIEDYWVLTATLGLEYRFTRNFSIGADFVHINEITEKEDHYDSTDYSKYNEFAQKNPRTCLLTDIRFYPFQNVFNGLVIKPYISLFSKVGTIITWTVPGYVFSNDEVVRRHGTFNDIGILLGAHFSGERAGLDFSLGYCKRTQKEDVEYFVTGGPNRLVNDQVIQKDRMACRLNLFYYLFRNKTGK